MPKKGGEGRVAGGGREPLFFFCPTTHPVSEAMLFIFSSFCTRDEDEAGA